MQCCVTQDRYQITLPHLIHETRDSGIDQHCPLNDQLFRIILHIWILYAQSESNQSQVCGCVSVSALHFPIWLYNTYTLIVMHAYNINSYCTMTTADHCWNNNNNINRIQSPCSWTVNWRSIIANIVHTISIKWQIQPNIIFNGIRFWCIQSIETKFARLASHWCISFQFNARISFVSWCIQHTCHLLGLP